MVSHENSLAEAKTRLAEKNYALASKYFINYITQEKIQPRPGINSLIEAHLGLIEALDGLTAKSAEKNDMAYATLFGALRQYFIGEKSKLETLLSQNPSN